MVKQTWTCALSCVFLCIFSLSTLSPTPVYGATTKKVTTKKALTKKATTKKPVTKPAVIASGPSVTAASAVVMDVATGDILYGKKADTPLPPASTTKIMTAILGLELGRPDEVVTVSEKAAAVGEASLHLDPGEKILLYELITGALVKSGNDACVAIAEHIAGSEKQFVKLMNTKALALGAQNTHFVNTNGLPLKAHVTTAQDLALMARHGLLLPQFAGITRQKTASIHFLEPDVFMDLKNTNKLLTNYPWANGVKTGTTTAAGKCLVASATKEGRQLLAVVLNAPDRFGDAQKLLEWGFERTETITLVEVGQAVGEFPSEKKSVKAFIENPIEVSIAKAERGKLQTRVLWEKSAKMPVRAGERLGHLEVWLGDKKLNSVPLFSENEVKAEPLSALFK